MATIEIDGKTLDAENGKMIIEVADDAGIHIPRFCYHKKLSVAANCRMCLVEVENGRKPVPACATPITNGMKVFTKSDEALRSQKAVMDFLLINHPLDCPICDQGGECELQDVSMGFGNDASHYEESKRAVEDENLGTLVATEMTRCIHCTRCVRFGDEIAGVRELGSLGRGESTEIGTYVEQSLSSEVSGNIIDLCPVGALTSKPYRFTARPWELTQEESVAPHDCFGSNIYVHVRRDELMRVVPKDNESINETWLSDRDRFSYLGLKNKVRSMEPKIKKEGQWQSVDWETALKHAAQGLARVIKQHGPEELAAFASPSSTLEELYLLQKMMRELGVNNLDHRLQQTDFADDGHQQLIPSSSISIEKIEHSNSILLLGCNVHREVPLAGVRVRKAYRNGAIIHALNSVDYDYHFDVDQKIIVRPQEMVIDVACLLHALVPSLKDLPVEAQKLLLGLEPNSRHHAIAKSLQQENTLIVTGALCENHPRAATLRTLVALIAQFSGAQTLRLTTGANSSGAYLAGMLPHRGAAGKVLDAPGLNAQQALEANLKAYLLLATEPGYDFANPHRARQSMLAAEFVVVVTAFNNESHYDFADVILPMAPFAETSGTYVNVEGVWQTVKGALKPYGESRPAWKILRVLANILHCKGFDFASSEEVRNELKTKIDRASSHKYVPYYPQSLLDTHQKGLVRVGEWPLYRCDAIVRHAKALQECASADESCVRIHPSTADKLNLEQTATVSQGDIEITLPLIRDERIVPEAVWLANAMPESVDLGHSFAAITIKR